MKRIFVVVAMIAVALAACSGVEQKAATPALEFATFEVTQTSSASRPISTQRPAAPATPDLASVPIIELDTTPRDSRPDAVRELGPVPKPSFLSFEQDHTVLYDIGAMTATDFGPGSIGNFSPNSRLMTWSSGDPGTFGASNEIWVVDLRTKQKRSLGQGRLPQFRDNQHVVALSGDSGPSTERYYVIDVDTGARSLSGPAQISGPTLTNNPVGSGSPRVSERRYVLLDGPNGPPLFQFVAGTASLVGTDELVIATPPTAGTTNIFTISIATRVASFVATARWSEYTLPLSANKDFVIWNDEYCGNPAGTIKLFDRRSGSLTQITARQFVGLTPDDLITVGEFGAKALVDPISLHYLVVLPNGRDSHWSPDYRYASQGVLGGHGGLCG